MTYVNLCTGSVAITDNPRQCVSSTLLNSQWSSAVTLKQIMMKVMTMMLAIMIMVEMMEMSHRARILIISASCTQSPPWMSAAFGGVHDWDLKIFNFVNKKKFFFHDCFSLHKVSELLSYNKKYKDCSQNFLMSSVFHSVCNVSPPVLIIHLEKTKKCVRLDKVSEQ